MSDLPIKKNVARNFYLPGLPSQANTKIFQVNPTIASGDFKYSIDGGTLTNLATLPDVFPAGGTQVRLQLSQAELNGNQINIVATDAAGAEWCSVSLPIFTSSTQMGDIAAAVWAVATSGLTTAGTIGKLIVDNLNATVSSVYNRLGAPAGASIAADIAAVVVLFAAIPAAVWAYATRTLTQSGATVSAAVSGTTITVSRGDTLVLALTGLGSLANMTKLYFTVKKGDVADTSAALQVEYSAGLLRIQGGGSITAGNASIAVNSSAAGDVTITVAAVEAAKLLPDAYSYDVQIVRSSGTPVSTMRTGTFTVSEDVTLAVS